MPAGFEDFSTEEMYRWVQQELKSAVAGDFVLAQIDFLTRHHLQRAVTPGLENCREAIRLLVIELKRVASTAR